MALYDTIKNFNQQFEYEPKVENKERFKKTGKFIVVGMGGSHLAADLIKVWKPEIDLVVHSDYGLPPLSDEIPKDCLVILSSYSGNTEEVLDAYESAKKKGLAIVAVSMGGKLLELAKNDGIPYIQMPDVGIQPRFALGYSLQATLKLMGEEDALKESSGLAYSLDSQEYETFGAALAGRLNGFLPIVYSSLKNFPVAYNWKIKFNETGKVPAFCNAIPELNHNEMTGFDINHKTQPLSEKFSFLLLWDEEDPPRIKKRMEVLDKLLSSRKFPVEILKLEGKNAFEKIFSSLMLADWTSYYLAEQYGVEAEQVPMVEEFKGLIQK